MNPLVPVVSFAVGLGVGWLYYGRKKKNRKDAQWGDAGRYQP